MMPQRMRGKALRNDNCPCGSFKKYKYCCLRKDRKVFDHWRKKREERGLRGKRVLLG